MLKEKSHVSGLGDLQGKTLKATVSWWRRHRQAAALPLLALGVSHMALSACSQGSESTSASPRHTLLPPSLPLWLPPVAQQREDSWNLEITAFQRGMPKTYLQGDLNHVLKNV